MKIIFSPIIVRSVLQVWTFSFSILENCANRNQSARTFVSDFWVCFFFGPCRELPLFVFCVSPLMFCCLRFEFLRVLDWGFWCSAVWCWVRGLVVSDVSKGRCALICSSQGIVTPWLLQAGNGIRSHTRKPELFSLLSVIQHNTLLFVNLHIV